MDGKFATHRVGGIEVTTLADGGLSFPMPDGFILNADRAAINEALAAASLPPDQITLHFNPVLVKTSGKLAVIDTGNGAGAAAAPGATSGFMSRSLEAAGVTPDAIDTVVISHFHGDHISGLLTAEGGPAFPNATVMVPAPEWAFWMNGPAEADTSGRMAKQVETNRKLFGALAGKIEHYEWGQEVLPGVIAEGTPGHTPGHTSFTVGTGSDSLFIQSDVTNNPALFVTHPGWRLMFDMDPEMAEATRRRTLDRAATHRTIVQGFHFPFPSRGRIEKAGDGYRLVPTG